MLYRQHVNPRENIPGMRDYRHRRVMNRSSVDACPEYKIAQRKNSRGIPAKLISAVPGYAFNPVRCVLLNLPIDGIPETQKMRRK